MLSELVFITTSGDREAGAHTPTDAVKALFTMLEALVAIRRAGADIIVTYAAPEVVSKLEA